MGQYRQIWADSLKGILILLVVLGHAIQGVYSDNVENIRLWCIIYSFHMPAFFAISGYFVKCACIGSGGATLKRVQQLLVPYFIWAILKLVIKGEVTAASLKGIIMDPVSFWFLWVLFWVYFLFQFSLYLHNISKSNFNYASLLMAALLIGLMAIINTKLFGFHLISYYFAFYALGYYIGQYKFMSIKMKPVLGALSVLWIFLAWKWSMHELPAWMPTVTYIPTSIIQLAYRFFTAFVAIVILLNVALILLKNSGRINVVCSRLGFYSLGVYTTHYLIIWYIADWIVKYVANTSIAVTLVFVIALPITLIMVWLIDKNKYTSAFLLGKVNRA